MDEYEPITGELRSYIRRATSTSDTCWWMASDTQNVRDLCDNIDAVHAQLECDFDRLKAERDSMAAALDAAQGEHAYAPESHYMMLPKDADGVPIHVGDVMEGEKIGGGFGEPFEVVGYIMSNGELEPMDKHKCPRKRKYSHHHAPTVEDVLREFGDWYAHTKGGCDEDGIIAEYAAKLRLAGEK